MNRIALYVFFHKEGIVEDYVLYYLKNLKTICSRIVLIANGKLADNAKKQLDKLSINYLIRENKGIDFAAWKYALESIGWNNVYQYDELILCNCSCYGPIYPFQEAFDNMEKRTCDFWGINRQPDMSQTPIQHGNISISITEHIQSYFYVFRHNVIISKQFYTWWKNLIPAKSYWEEIKEHEIKFSKYLEDSGFKSDTLMNFYKYKTLSTNGDYWYHNTDIQLIEDRNPLLKRKSIYPNTDMSIKILEYIYYNTKYPIKCIVNNLKHQKNFSLFTLFRFYILKFISHKKELYKIKEKKYLLLYYLYLQSK